MITKRRSFQDNNLHHHVLSSRGGGGVNGPSSSTGDSNNSNHSNNNSGASASSSPYLTAVAFFSNEDGKNTLIGQAFELLLAEPDYLKNNDKNKDGYGDKTSTLNECEKNNDNNDRRKLYSLYRRCQTMNSLIASKQKNLMNNHRQHQQLQKKQSIIPHHKKHLLPRKDVMVPNGIKGNHSNTSNFIPTAATTTRRLSPIQPLSNALNNSNTMGVMNSSTHHNNTNTNITTSQNIKAPPKNALTFLAALNSKKKQNLTKQITTTMTNSISTSELKNKNNTTSFPPLLPSKSSSIPLVKRSSSGSSNNSNHGTYNNKRKHFSSSPTKNIGNTSSSLIRTSKVMKRSLFANATNIPKTTATITAANITPSEIASNYSTSSKTHNSPNIASSTTNTNDTPPLTSNSQKQEPATAVAVATCPLQNTPTPSSVITRNKNCTKKTNHIEESKDNKIILRSQQKDDSNSTSSTVDQNDTNHIAMIASSFPTTYPIGQEVIAFHNGQLQKAIVRHVQVDSITAATNKLSPSKKSKNKNDLPNKKGLDNNSKAVTLRRSSRNASHSNTSPDDNNESNCNTGMTMEWKISYTLEFSDGQVQANIPSMVISPADEEEEDEDDDFD